MKVLDSIDNFDQKKFYKRLVIIVVLIIILFIIYKLMKKEISALFSKSKSQQLNESLENEIEVSKLSYPDSDFILMADSLYIAMDGAATDEDAIYRVFNKMQTRADVLQLIKAFGEKEGENLAEWLGGDLSSAEIGKVNKILADKNIKYSF